MKIDVSEKGSIILEEVYAGLGFKTNSGETLFVCMRDSGFELTYKEITLSLQKGIVKIKGTDDEGEKEKMLLNELDKTINAGNKLATEAHRVQADFDGIHRLRIAIANWYETRANEFSRGPNEKKEE